MTNDHTRTGATTELMVQRGNAACVAHALDDIDSI